MNVKLLANLKVKFTNKLYSTREDTINNIINSHWILSVMSSLACLNWYFVINYIRESLFSPYIFMLFLYPNLHNCLKVDNTRAIYVTNVSGYYIPKLLAVFIYLIFINVLFSIYKYLLKHFYATDGIYTNS